MPNPTAAMLVIGDEILSGRTRDSNTHHLAGELTRHGIDLREVRVVADDHAAIVAAVHALRTAYDHVFTSGGIGPTHDDITADAIAAAFATPISIRADARALLQAHYDRQGTVLNEARLRMARIPDGASLIDNPVSAAPGFTLGNVHVMAGVPRCSRRWWPRSFPPSRAARPSSASRSGSTAAKATSQGRFRPSPPATRTCPWAPTPL
jgi:molybdenum cofactor synthesis domain-containing protein